MATFITHIVLGGRVRTERFPQLNRAQFVVGTSFPDIRYLADVSRNKTHFDKLQLDEINPEAGAFMAGLKVHSWVDLEREKLVRELGLYDYLPRSRASVVALKLAEDQLLYDQVDDWSEVARAFGDVLDEELKFGVERGQIERWHEIMARYVSQKPDRGSIERLIDNIGVANEDEKAEILATTEQALNDSRVQSYVQVHLPTVAVAVV